MVHRDFPFQSIREKEFKREIKGMANSKGVPVYERKNPQNYTYPKGNYDQNLVCS